MHHSLAQVDHIMGKLGANTLGSWGEVREKFSSLEVAAKHELSSIFVGYIGADSARYWDQTKPFGEAVYDNFPSTRADVLSAGNCHAVEEYTACVFHCMRVVEKGIRALARERNIKVIKGKLLEWNDWGAIIKAIRDRSEQFAAKLRPGPARDKIFEFYRGATGEMEGFKDTYRNYVTHDRATYDKHDSLTAYHRVGEFMKRLAVQLSENYAGAIKWPRK
jgi:hypothetical protein